MRALRLAQIAAEAEALHLRRLARRTAFRAAYGALGLLFVLAAIGVAHFIIWLELTRALGSVNAALILLGGDLFLAVVFALLAASLGPGRIEREAVQIRQIAVQQAKRSFGVVMLLAPATGYARSRGFLGRALAAVTDLIVRR